MTAKVKDFSLQATLECGQFFRYAKTGGGYKVYAGSSSAYVSQEKDMLVFSDYSGPPEFWLNLFDLNRDYSEVNNALAEKDEVLRKALAFAPGIRIMNQEPFETLISFIISANNRIPMIQTVIANIADRFGENAAFPSPNSLAEAEEPELRACKTGFRAKYIQDAAARFGALELKDKSTDETREALMTIKGVGHKVADCVMLFSMGKRDAFPIDVWIGRAMRRFYFDDKDVPLKEIQAFAKDKFGDLAGYANQLLFHYTRTGEH